MTTSNEYENPSVYGVYSFSWKELMGYYDTNTDVWTLYEHPQDYVNNATSKNGFLAMLRHYNGSYSQVASSAYYNMTTSLFMANYVLPRLWNLTAVHSLNGDYTDNDDIIAWCYRVNAFLVSSYPYYSAIINSYESQKDKLLNAITSNSTNKDKFSDMPQTASIESDDHVSTITEGTASVEDMRDTPIARLAEIREKLDNTYERWASDFFDKFFIEN